MATQTKKTPVRNRQTGSGPGKRPQLDTLREKNAASQGLGHLIPEKWRGPAAIIAIFISLLIFFRGVLDATHVFNAGDNLAFDELLPFLHAAQAQGYSMPQWIPNIFCGMPAFAALVITGSRIYDLVYQVFVVIRSIPVALFPNAMVMPYLWHYFVFGLGMYLLLRLTRNTSRMVALFAAFTAIFSTWIITYVMIGHDTKIFAVMTMPYIFLAIEKLRTPKMDWQSIVFWSAVLAVAIHLLFEATHPQMTFYIGMAVLIYFIVSLITEWFRKSSEGRAHYMKPLVRSGILALVMAGIGFAMSADRYMASLAYEPFSIRGKAPIHDITNDAAQNTGSVNHATTSSGGLDWNYATAWSFSPQEMITFLIPGYYGSGEMHYSGTELNIPPEEVIPTYWGQMNGTDAPNYTGIVVFMLAIVGIFSLWKRDRLVPPLTIIAIFSVLLSFGGNWPILFGPMFHSFPLFNKFRAPMMALVLMQLAFPILAALTLEEVLRVWKQKNATEEARLGKQFKIALYLSAAFLAISVVFRGSITSGVKDGFLHSSTSRYYGQAADVIASFVAGVAANDALVCAILVTLAAGVIFYFLKRKVSPVVLAVGIMALTVFDLWRIDNRRVEIVSKDTYQSNLETHDYIQFIQKDTSLFRVEDMNETQPSNKLASYGLQTPAGYHAAKMREFQDVVDETGHEQGNGIYNPFMWNLMNTKYIIANGAVSNDRSRFIPAFVSKEPPHAVEGSKDEVPTIVWQNPDVLPRAFFVYRYQVEPQLDILHAMDSGSFNPRDVLFFDEAPNGMPALDQAPIDTSKEKLTMDYKNEDITIHTTTAGNRLLFMSDTWYPDWHVTIDGKPATIYRADYAFRAIAVPAGQHELKLTYYDPHYAAGRTISLITNALALIGLGIGVVGFTYSRKKKRPEVEVLPEA